MKRIIILTIIFGFSLVITFYIYEKHRDICMHSCYTSEMGEFINIHYSPETYNPTYYHDKFEFYREWSILVNKWFHKKNPQMHRTRNIITVAQDAPDDKDIGIYIEIFESDILFWGTSLFENFEQERNKEWRDLEFLCVSTYDHDWKKVSVRDSVVRFQKALENKLQTNDGDL